MRQDHLGRLRPACQPGTGRPPGLPALHRPCRRPRRRFIPRPRAGLPTCRWTAPWSSGRSPAGRWSSARPSVPTCSAPAGPGTGPRL